MSKNILKVAIFHVAGVISFSQQSILNEGNGFMGMDVFGNA